jgi:alkanesulfonate monooxygenase SsuD/methylene tetrahydromethanopterin reductase-like flavin-dependent oxidoreductase (luciferase family)
VIDAPRRGPHIGFKLPNCGGVMCEVAWANPNTILELAGLASELRFDSVWLHDHTVTPRELQHLDQPPFYEPLVVMAALASQIGDIEIGVATLILPFRDPVILTKQIITLERFFPRRFIFGLGLGQYESEFESFGVDTYRSRGKVANEYLEIMKALMDGGGASVSGAFRSVRDAHMFPKGSFPTEPPIWIGGNSAPAMQRAARYGRGWIFSGALAPGNAREQLDTLAEAPRPFDVVLTATVARQDGLSADGEDGHHIHQHSSVMAGSADEVARQIGDYVAAGVTYFLLTFRSSDLAAVESQMRWFATEVRPTLSAQLEAAGRP